MRYSCLEIMYLLLSVLGLSLTWYFNIQFMQASGGAFDLVRFVKAGYANAASTSLVND